MKRIALIALAVVVPIVIVTLLVWLGYLQTGLSAYIDPTGDYHPAKTLWDWMELLIIPVVLAGGGLLYSWRERKAEREEAQWRAKTEREIADDRNRETALQNYLDKMTELLLDRELRTSEPAQDIARARTLTVLRSLDGERKGILLQFLQESDLIKGEKPVVFLEGANLIGAFLGWANLTGANLSATNLVEAFLGGSNLIEASLTGANLTKANLTGTFLGGSNLMEASLVWADLTGADLVEANLREANLIGANLIGANLRGADLAGAIYNDDTIWPDGFTLPPEVIKV